ncbi:MAG: BON domain-containing protein [Polyangiaceae bacterium]
MREAAMGAKHDPRERWRWEEEREREDRGLESERRFARHAGDPRWGTGGARVERAPRASSRAAVAPTRHELRGRYTGRGPRGYHRSDERIYEDVCEMLTRNGAIDASDVVVTVKQGKVVLSGTIATRTQSHVAEGVAGETFGVVEVQNSLCVRRVTSAPGAPPVGASHRARGHS